MDQARQTPSHLAGWNDPLTRLLVAVVDAYRWILSPWVGQHCRFHPTCSAYAREALLVHGPARGSWLAVRRLARCAPWCEGGIDLVPPARTQPLADQFVEPDT